MPSGQVQGSWVGGICTAVTWGTESQKKGTKQDHYGTRTPTKTAEKEG